MMDQALATLIGGLIASLSGFVAIYYKEYLESNRTNMSLKWQMKGEISALLDLIKKNKYIELLQAAIQETANGRAVAFGFESQKKYSHIYEANANKIGALGPQTAHKIIRFYILMNSTLEDKDQYMMTMQNLEKKHGNAYQTNPDVVAYSKRVCEFLLAKMQEVSALAEDILSDLK